MAKDNNTAQQATEASGAQDPAPSSAGLHSRKNERKAQETKAASDGNVTPSEDEKLAANAHDENFGKQPEFRVGKITWVSPYTHWYRVEMNDGQGNLPCCFSGDTSNNPLSTRSITTIPPNTMCLVYKEDGAPFGIIICTFPDIVTDGGSVHPDWISQGSNGGFRREKYHKKFPDYFELDGGQIDFSNWRPVDGAAMGEWGRFDDLGGGIFIDPFMKFLRVDESCGLFLFYMDRAARLCANNLDFRSAMWEMISKYDDGEGMQFQGSTPYPHEALGAFEFGTDTRREIDDHAVHYDEPYGKYEPQTDDQQAFYRYEQYEGYLGQAYMRQVMLPPNSGGLNKYPDTSERIGVFREQIALDGGYALESAQSIAIMKRVLIPIPKRLKMVEDPKGDDLREESGYKFASLHGSGPDHKIQGTPKATGELPNLLKATAVQDMLAYIYNWKSLHPFHYHKKDFDTPEETDLSPLTTLQRPPQFGQLASQQWLDEETPVEVKVDHRQTKASYYETTAGLFVTPDGSVVVRDAYGSETRWSGGSIQNSAPGDIWHQAGRNVNLWAGDDIIARAVNSIDLTTTKHDIRFKAERHLEGLAGNNGALGRVFFECQSSGPQHDVTGKEGEDVLQSGIIFKAKQAEVITWASSIYLRTGGGEVLPGMITFDAAKGDQVIRNVAATVIDHVKFGSNIAIPVGDKDVVYHFGPSVAQIPKPVCMEGGLLIVKNGIQMRGPLAGIECTVISDRNPGGLIPQWQKGDEGWDIVEENLQFCKDAFAEMNAALTKDYNEGIKDFWYPAKRPGNDSVMTDSQFAPRNLDQMRTQDFRLPENYWQQLETGSPTWTEKVIVYQGNEFMPHPGKDPWTTGDRFRRADFKLHDKAAGIDKPRDGGLYEDPDLKEWKKEALDGNYPVSVS